MLDYGEAVVKAVANYINVPYIAPNDNEIKNTYIVKRGDSLYSIATKYGITVNELKAANNLTSNILTVGQVLNIPLQTTPDQLPSTDYIIYTVKRGDTLYKIANDYNISVNEIIDFNQLTSTGLIIGQQLLIPNKNQNQIETFTYIIKRGDSLWNLAKLCNITIDEIISLNNLQTTIIQPGDTLILPNTCNINNEENDNDNNSNQQYLRYIVTNNDTLYGIARKYNVSVEELVELNGLTTNLLRIGQELLIPTSSNYLNYYVQPNDTLVSYILTINQLLLIPS